MPVSIAEAIQNVGAKPTTFTDENGGFEAALVASRIMAEHLKKNGVKPSIDADVVSFSTSVEKPKRFGDNKEYYAGVVVSETFAQAAIEQLAEEGIPAFSVRIEEEIEPEPERKSLLESLRSFGKKDESQSPSSTIVERTVVLFQG